MNYDREYDEDKPRRAKRSKAGSLKPRLPSSPRSFTRKEFVPQAVVKITAWAKSPSSVKRMMDYISRSTGIEEPGDVEELAKELQEGLDKKEFTDPSEKAKAAYMLELANAYKGYMLRSIEINEKRDNELKELRSKGEVKPEQMRDLYQRFADQHERNFEYVKAHAWNMGEEYDIDINVTARISNAFGNYEKQKKKIEEQSRNLAKEHEGNFWKAPEEKRAAIVHKHRENAATLKTSIYETSGILDLKVKSVQDREEAKSKRRHPKGEKGKTLMLEDEIGVQYRSAFEIKMLYDNWAKDMPRKQPGKQAPRHAVHIALSAKADLNPGNVERVLKAARATAREYFGKKGYEYVLGVHQDGKYPHAHLIVKTKNRETGKKLDLRKKDIQDLRKVYARRLTQHGLEHVATQPKMKAKIRPSNWPKNKNLSSEQRLHMEQELERVRKAREATQTRLARAEAEGSPKATQKAYQKEIKLLDKDMVAIQKQLGKPQGLRKETESLVKRMEQEQKSFSRKMSRAKPRVDALMFREAQAKSLDTQREKVKQDTELNEEDRKSAFNTLRAFRRKVEKGVDMEAEGNATYTELVEKMDEWQRDAQKLEKESARNDLMPNQRQQLSLERKDMDERGRNLVERVEHFQDQLKELEIPVELKKKMYRGVRDKSLDVQKTRNRFLGRGRGL